jgi:1-acyl-sn-glycerol-3-phosphate acyltransferase
MLRAERVAAALLRTWIGPVDPVPPGVGMVVRALRAAAAIVIRGWLRGYHRFTIVGLENLPQRGSFVMVANHCSHLDGLCLLSALPLKALHRAFPAAAADYFFNSTAGCAISRLVMNALPFHRGSGVRQSLCACRRLIGRQGSNPGNILILFPEGTRSTSGVLGSFRRGIGDVVAGSDVPVVPCHLNGTHAAWPKGTFLPRPRRLTLTIGPRRCYADVSRDKHTAELIADELREAVLALAPSHTGGVLP